MPSENARVESVYLSYLPENGEEEDEAIKPQGSSNSPSPSPSAAPQEPLRRPLNLGIATAAVNRAAAAAQQQQQQQHQQAARTNLPSPNSAEAASMMASNNGAAAGQPSRVQQRLRAGHAGGPLPAGNQQHQQQQRSPPVHARQLMGHQQPVQQQQQQQRPSPPPQYRMAPQQQHAPMQRPPQMRPLELRGGQARPQGPPYPQQSQQSQLPRANRPQIPVLQVTVPPPAHQVQAPPRSPFSSSTETLVGSPLAMQKQKQQQYASVPASHPQKGASGGNWSPSSSSGSSHSANHYGGQPQRSPLGGMAPVSPSIKNLQLQLPAERTADPENDRLSPAMPGVGNSQKDWWKRFSTVVHQNEEREAMAEKTGSKAATKAQSEWLDKQSHRQRKYRIWVGVIAFLILAAIGGGLAYHFLTKGKESVNTQPTTHDFGLGTSTKAVTPSSTADDGAAATTPTSFMPAPSAVPAGNHLSSVVAAGRLAKRREAATPAFGAARDLLALPSATSGALRQRSLQHAAAPSGNGHAHAQRRRNFDRLD